MNHRHLQARIARKRHAANLGPSKKDGPVYVGQLVTDDCICLLAAISILKRSWLLLTASFGSFFRRTNASKLLDLGRLRLLTPWPGALPLNPTGCSAQDPVIGSRSALAMSFSPCLSWKNFYGRLWTLLTIIKVLKTAEYIAQY